MLYFREKEKEKLSNFRENPRAKAMAVYGRRRTGKTALMLDYLQGEGKGSCYYQCTSYDYSMCLSDFLAAVNQSLDNGHRVPALNTFREVFQYLSDTGFAQGKVLIIDEFPFLARKDENVTVEFQWIIDHALKGMKLILLGSNLSFMRKQINDLESPLYGRFDEILEIRPFTFPEVFELFQNFEDAVNVYAQTGGVAQYVMLFLDYPSRAAATDALFLDANGRLFAEAGNLLMQEVREQTTYMAVLRAIGTGEKESGQIAAKCLMDARNVFTYLKKLEDLEIVSIVDNPLGEKKVSRRYRISDNLFRFHYAFIEPNISMITALGSQAGTYIFNDRYHEFLGIVYEDIIRSGCFTYAAKGILPFMPFTIGKWWGNVKDRGAWAESEVDLIAYDGQNIVIGECKFRNKAMGMKELDGLKVKATFIPTGNRKIYYLLASKSGFTEDLERLQDAQLILLKEA